MKGISGREAWTYAIIRRAGVYAVRGAWSVNMNSISEARPEGRCEVRRNRPCQVRI